MTAIALFALGLGTGSLLVFEQSGFEFETQTQSMAKQSITVKSTAAQFQEDSLQDDSQYELKPKIQLPEDLVPKERDSPSDWIKENQIALTSEGVQVKASNLHWAILANTNSMDPVFDDGSHLIQKVFTSPKEVKQTVRIGDIISYKSPQNSNFVIVHRIVEMNEDDSGWYVITKRDNNPSVDPWKIRAEDVTRVTVMIIY